MKRCFHTLPIWAPCQGRAPNPPVGAVLARGIDHIGRRQIACRAYRQEGGPAAFIERYTELETVVSASETAARGAPFPTGRRAGPQWDCSELRQQRWAWRRWPPPRPRSACPRRRRTGPPRATARLSAVLQRRRYRHLADDWTDTFGLTQSPATPAPGQTVTVTFTATTGSNNGPVPMNAGTCRSSSRWRSAVPRAGPSPSADQLPDAAVPAGGNPPRPITATGTYVAGSAGAATPHRQPGGDLQQREREDVLLGRGRPGPEGCAGGDQIVESFNVFGGSASVTSVTGQTVTSAARAGNTINFSATGLNANATLTANLQRGRGGGTAEGCRHRHHRRHRRRHRHARGARPAPPRAPYAGGLRRHQHGHRPDHDPRRSGHLHHPQRRRLRHRGRGHRHQLEPGQHRHHRWLQGPPGRPAAARHRGPGGHRDGLRHRWDQRHVHRQRPRPPRTSARCPAHRSRSRPGPASADSCTAKTGSATTGHCTLSTTCPRRSPPATWRCPAHAGTRQRHVLRRHPERHRAGGHRRLPTVTVTDFRGSTFGWSLVGTVTDFTGTPGGSIAKATSPGRRPARPPRERPTRSPPWPAPRVRSTARRSAPPRRAPPARVAASTPAPRSTLHVPANQLAGSYTATLTLTLS